MRMRIPIKPKVGIPWNTYCMSETFLRARHTLSSNLMEDKPHEFNEMSGMAIFVCHLKRRKESVVTA
jgi:hypothetical protein